MEGLPECRLVQLLSSGTKTFAELGGELSRFGVPAAKRAGWIAISGEQVSLTGQGHQAVASGSLPKIPSGAKELASLPPAVISELQRRALVRLHEKKEVRYAVTQNGLSALEAGLEAEPYSIGAITRPMLLDGSWKGKPFRKYDISTEAPPSPPARSHPISALSGKISSIFTSMGFEEMSGPIIESAFWNFDALFQPQDHPARDLADTFYLPGSAHLPSRHVVEHVRHSHKAGWSYEWEEKEAKRRVLRTHTTSVSARTLHEISKSIPISPRAARRFFCIGKVFRNEATDYKHLAEFYQVEGIIAWEGATFRDLLGTLKEFYARLGFGKIRFRPSFFPYTEPSLEIEVFYPSRNAWMELGGAGMLRPEVCGPLGSPYPVLAWGLSLERPLMLAHKIDDIRSLYRNEIGWLRNFPMQ